MNSYSGERSVASLSSSPLLSGTLEHFGLGRQSVKFPLWFSGKESAFNAGVVGDLGAIPGLGRPPGGGHGNPLQYSCLENPMDRGAWWATVHKSQRVRHNWSD